VWGFLLRTPLCKRKPLAWGVASSIAPLFLVVATLAGEVVTADDNGRGSPIYRVAADGTVDWSTFNGYRRYGAACLACHGADGLGSTFAPSMTEALKTLSYDAFVKIVVEGTQTLLGTSQAVMPPFGKDPNVACYIDDIYVYLQARSDGAVPRGRPSKRQSQTVAALNAERECLRGFGTQTE